jgi:hypothetical protein
VLPLISLPIVQKSIKKGIQSWIKSQGGDCSEEYCKGKPPADYQRGDGWAEDLENFKEGIAKDLISTGFLKEYETKLDSDGFIDEDLDSEEFWKYCEYRDAALEPFVKYYEKTSLRAYQMYGACHWWNPTFCLTLAKLIYPTETWLVQRGKEHTTVVNKNKTLVFDILYFDPADPTLGGANALAKSTIKASHE